MDAVAGTVSEMPAVPETVAVAVRVPASAAVAVTSASAAIAPMIKIRCLISCCSPGSEGISFATRRIGEERGKTRPLPV